jgi:hypothetical protein
VKKKNTKKSRSFFLYLLMVELFWTTQAAILLPLTENGGTGLRSFALPLSHFLWWGEREKTTHNVFETNDEINMGGYEQFRKTLYLSAVVEQLRHHFTGHKPSLFLHHQCGRRLVSCSGA